MLAEETGRKSSLAVIMEGGTDPAAAANTSHPASPYLAVSPWPRTSRQRSLWACTAVRASATSHDPPPESPNLDDDRRCGTARCRRRWCLRLRSTTRPPRAGPSNHSGSFYLAGRRRLPAQALEEPPLPRRSRNRPFLLVGDSPQALIGALSVRDAGAYIANRRSAGFNALWVNLLCTTYTGCRSDGKTFDGIAPFNRSGDLATPNPAYFARAEAMIRLAAKAGIVVFLDPIETGGWFTSSARAEPARLSRTVGSSERKFKNDANIVWLNGNDFQTWRKAKDDALVLAVARASDRWTRCIPDGRARLLRERVARRRALASLISIDCAYTYGPTYARVHASTTGRTPFPW